MILIYGYRKEGKEEAKGVQIFEICDFFMQKKIKEKVQLDKSKGKGETLYADWSKNEGKQIWFNMKLDGKNWVVSGHEFEDRDYSTDDDSDDAVALDQIITVLEYDEIENILKGTTPEEVEDEPEAVAVTNDDAVSPDPEEDVPLGDELVETYTKCPHECEFGKEWDVYQCCNESECEAYMDCRIAKEKLMEAEAEKKKAEAEAKPKKKPAKKTGKRTLRK